jgi:FkbM family methyltransferase
MAWKCPPLHLPNWNNLWKWKQEMTHPDQRFGGKTYAQHGDDIVIRCVFDSLGIDNPSYLDIGAHHPTNISNTKLFYDTGSRGINVEANPHLFQQFMIERPDDVNLNFGVGVESGFLDFYMVDEHSGRNSFDYDTVAAFVADYPEFSIREVRALPVMTVAQILQNRAIPDFLSIDVEGLDYDILKSIDFKRYPFKLICVEVGGSDKINYADAVSMLLETNGYFSLIRCGANLIFVAKQYEHLVR